ncbi:transglycosylase SLT domain-containing protein [Salmonella enterica]
MDAEKIRKYLLSLGLDIQEVGGRIFSVLTEVTTNTVNAGRAVENAALSIFTFTEKVASRLDDLYLTSQRTGMKAEGIEAIGYAVSQVGGRVDEAQSSLEKFAQFVNESPGAEGFLKRLGVQTRDANGEMIDMASTFMSVGQKLSTMSGESADKYAQKLGIDENTLMAMRSGMGQFSEQYNEMTKAIGFDADGAAASSNKFMTSLRAFSQFTGMIQDKIGARLAEGLVGPLDKLRQRVMEIFPQIEPVLMKGIAVIIDLGEALAQVGYRVLQGSVAIADWWKRLDQPARKLIVLFGGLVAALRVLNSAFWMSPIGLITGLGIALLALWDDYQVWKEGGEHLIDWQTWEPELKAAHKNFTNLINDVKDLATSVANLLGIDPEAWSLKWELSSFATQMGEFGKMLGMIADLLDAIQAGNWSEAASVGKKLLKQGENQPNSIPSVTNHAQKANASMGASWHLLKEEVGDVMRDLGINTDFGKRKGTVKGNNLHTDIPGGEAPVSAIGNKNLIKKSQGNTIRKSEPYRRLIKPIQPSKEGARLLNSMQPTFARLEQLYHLPTGLLRSVAIAESRGNRFAVSNADAKGLFQFIDPTARDMGLHGDDVFDPMKATQAAAKYLHQLLRANGGDLNKALASYNWGIGHVQKPGMERMPPETRNYIPKVMSNMPQQGVLQQNTYNIYGGDAQTLGTEVERRQQSSNAQLLRGAQAKVG